MTNINFNNVTNRLKAAGKIKSEADMGNLLGKGKSYVSSRKWLLAIRSGWLRDHWLITPASIPMFDLKAIPPSRPANLACG